MGFADYLGDMMPWDAVSNLSQLEFDGKCIVGNGYRIFCEQDVEIQQNAVIMGDVKFGKGCRLGPFSFLRGPLILGDNVKIGPYVEVTRSIVLDNTIIAHKNIIVDSMIGSNVHFSGFATTCNLPTGRAFVKACFNDLVVELDHKYGCAIEDHVDLGINVFVMPGAHIGSGEAVLGPSIVYGRGKVKSCVR